MIKSECSDPVEFIGRKVLPAGPRVYPLPATRPHQVELHDRARCITRVRSVGRVQAVLGRSPRVAEWPGIYPAELGLR